MTAKTSLFNKGIYKSTVKRCLWGSVLYFVLLFLTTSMDLLSNISDTSLYTRYYYDVSLLYTSMFMLPAILMAIVVPTVVAMLVFRFVHSKKTAVFFHSLPVSRNANYVSTVAAAFTLMAAPVVLNGIILMLLSLGAYSECFSLVHCLVWIGINLMCQFIMFSIATLAAMITGNTFAMPVLNILLNIFPATIISGFMIMAENFLYGYVDNNNILSSINEANPTVWIIMLTNQLDNTHLISENFNDCLWKMPWFLIGAVVLYVLSWFLYKKRGMESAEDIAPFKALNPIYKYFVTFIGTLTVYSISNGNLYNNPFMFFSVLAIFSAIIYFACEMLLKKTLKVWGAYKGYLCFVLSFAAVMGVFAFTSFFGYETRVPSASDVKKVAMYDAHYYRPESPYVENAEVIEYVISQHKELASHRTDHIADSSYIDDNPIVIEYELKNGKVIKRKYDMTYDAGRKVLSSLYENDEYIKATQFIFRDNEIISITLDNEVKIYDEGALKELVECIRSDMLNLGYNDLVLFRNVGIHLDVEYKVEADDDRERSYIEYEGFRINSNYTNTINWLKENGYKEFAELNFPQ